VVCTHCWIFHRQTEGSDNADVTCCGKPIETPEAEAATGNARPLISDSHLALMTKRRRRSSVVVRQPAVFIGNVDGAVSCSLIHEESHFVVDLPV